MQCKDKMRGLQECWRTAQRWLTSISAAMTSELSGEGAFEHRGVVKPLVFLCRHLALARFNRAWERMKSKMGCMVYLTCQRADQKPLHELKHDEILWWQQKQNRGKSWENMTGKKCLGLSRVRHAARARDNCKCGLWLYITVEACASASPEKTTTAEMKKDGWEK